MPLLQHLRVCDGPGLMGVISGRDLSKAQAETAADLMKRTDLLLAFQRMLQVINKLLHETPEEAAA